MIIVIIILGESLDPRVCTSCALNENKWVPSFCFCMRFLSLNSAKFVLLPYIPDISGWGFSRKSELQMGMGGWHGWCEFFVFLCYLIIVIVACTTAIRCKRGFTATITPALLLISKLHFSHGHEENQREWEGEKRDWTVCSPHVKKKKKMKKHLRCAPKFLPGQSSRFLSTTL